MYDSFEHENMKAENLCADFHGRSPRKVVEREINLKPGMPLVKLGEVNRIDYISDKWDDIKRIYEHTFKKKPELFSNADGDVLIIAFGNFSVIDRGILDVPKKG